MATGFVQRWKGKQAIPYGGIYQNGIPSAGIFLSTAAPTSGSTAATLAGIAPAGAILIDSANKTLYQNVNTQASPTWKLIAETTASGAYVGTFDGAIGGNTPAAGTFTSVSSPSITSTGLISGPLNGAIGSTGAAAGNFTSVAASAGFAGAIGSTAPAAGAFTSLKESVTSVSTQGAAIGNSGLTQISSTDIKASFPLAEPVAGIRKRLQLIAVSSGVQINAAPATFDGTNPVITSTQISSIVLSGLSTSRWAIDSVYPGSTLANSILGLSATT